MIELMYLLSDFQCGASAPKAIISADIYRHGTLIANNLSVGDKVMLQDMDGVTFSYNLQYGGCEVSPLSKTLSKTDPIPNLPGAYSQASLQDHLNGLKHYEQLYAVEIGTHNENSSYYDLQDIVFIINNNPLLPD